MKPKVVLDANIFVSALLNPKGSPAKVINAWITHKFDCIISMPLLTEIARVLEYPRIRTKYNLRPEEIIKFLQSIDWRGEKVNVSGRFKLCRDPKDDLILETAVMGEAKYLVSRDDDIKRDLDLTAQMTIHGVTVLSVRAFLEGLENNKL